MNQTVVHLRPKNASVSGRLHLPNPPFAQQQNPPQFNISCEIQLPNATSIPTREPVTQNSASSTF